MVELQDIRRARQRIGPYVRKTPLLCVNHTKNSVPFSSSLYLKLENLQVSGSFKARGAVNKVLSLTPEEIASGLITASGGNHGLGLAYAGRLCQAPTSIYLPYSTPRAKAQKLEEWGAQVTYEGAVWDDANRAALKLAEEKKLTYVHPFADPIVIAGQGTIGLEVLEDLPDIDILLVAIGGGGLISGVSLAAKALKPTTKVIGIEPVGAPTLYNCLHAGQLVELQEITTCVGSLAARLSTQVNLSIVQEHVDDVVLVTDDEMREGARWLWHEVGVAAELGSAAPIAALLTGKIQIRPEQKVCAIVCASGSDAVCH
jgi:threonine dehydratase